MRRNPWLPAATLAPLAAVLLACGDPLGMTATEPTIRTQLGVYAMQFAPPTYPAAVNTFFPPRAVPVDPFGNFDIAFDLDEEGFVVVYPVSMVVAPLVGVNRIGLRKVETSFDETAHAPPGQYPRDEPVRLGANDVLVIEAEKVHGFPDCTFALSPFIYTKLLVTAVDYETGVISLRVVVNPNCGFRSFLEGIPRN